MKKADYVSELTVTDPDTHLPVEVAIYKDRETGGMFGIDASYIVTLSDDDPVSNPFTGKDIQLIETQENTKPNTRELKPEEISTFEALVQRAISDNVQIKVQNLQNMVMPLSEAKAYYGERFDSARLIPVVWDEMQQEYVEYGKQEAKDNV